MLVVEFVGDLQEGAVVATECSDPLNGLTTSP